MKEIDEEEEEPHDTTTSSEKLFKTNCGSYKNNYKWYYFVNKLRAAQALLISR